MSFWKTLGKGMMSSLGTSVASGLGSGFVNALFNSPQKQMRNSKRLMAEQARINKDLFDYQYQKELPSVRVAQLKQAGLNPALMYSGSGVSGLNAQMGHSSPASAPRLDLMTNSNPLAAAQVYDLEASAKLKEQSAKTEEKETILKHIQTLQAEYELKEISPERKREILQAIEESQKRIEEMDSQISVNESTARYNDAKTLTDIMMRKYNIERYKVQNKLDNARAWREAINAKFENEHNYTMSSNGGYSGIINRLSQAFFGTHKFQDWIQNVGNGTYDETNAVSQLVKTFESIFANDKDSWELFFPLASMIYRIAKANF